MQTEKLITILGATGPQGRSVIDHLLKLNNSAELKGEKYRVRGVCKDIHKKVAEELKSKGVDVKECDWGDKENVIKCTKGSYLVFGATQHFQHLIMETPELEVTWGKNMVDACLENKVPYFIWSSLENADEVSKGKYNLPFMTNKNKVEQYARQFSDRMKSIFVYAGGYFENYFNFLKVDKESGRGLQGVMYAPIITPFPQFDVYDLGKIVVPIIQNPEPWVGKRILAAFQNIGMKEVADIFSKVLEIPVRFELQDHEHFAQQRGKELADFYAYVETFGIMRNQEQELIRTLSHFKQQGFKDLASWVELNKDHWLHGETPSRG